MSYLILGCRGVLAGVFLVSLVGKLWGYPEFVTATGTLLAVPARHARLLAPVTVVVELLAVVALAVPGLVRLGFVLAAVLLGCFSAALVAAIRRGSRASCRCFGASRAPVGGHQVVRNLALVAVAVVGFVADVVIVDRGYELAGVAVVGVASAVCVLVVARLDDLVALLRT